MKCQDNVFVRASGLLLPPLPLHSSPPHLHYSQITSKCKCDPTTHLHKNLPWLLPIEFSPIPQPAMPSTIFPQPTFPTYSHHITHSPFQTYPLWSFPYRNCHKDPVALCFLNSKMLFLCASSTPSPIYPKSHSQEFRANAPSLCSCCPPFLGFFYKDLIMFYSV